MRCLGGRPHRHASACLAATRRLSGCHGLGIKSTPGGSWSSRGCPDVRITGRKGQRSLTSRAKSIPSIRPGSRISAKIIATSRPRISIVARAASALSHSMVSSSPSSSSLAVNSRSSSVVLDNQHRSTILLGLSHIYAPPLSARYETRFHRQMIMPIIDQRSNGASQSRSCAK